MKASMSDHFSVWHHVFAKTCKSVHTTNELGTDLSCKETRGFLLGVWGHRRKKKNKKQKTKKHVSVSLRNNFAGRMRSTSH